MPTHFQTHLAVTREKTKAAKRRAAIRYMLNALDEQSRKDAPKKLPSYRWLALSERLGVSIHTMQHWARNGRVPHSAATALQNTFGESKVLAAELDDPTPRKK